MSLPLYWDKVFGQVRGKEARSCTLGALPESADPHHRAHGQASGGGLYLRFPKIRGTYTSDVSWTLSPDVRETSPEFSCIFPPRHIHFGAQPLTRSSVILIIDGDA